MKRLLMAIAAALALTLGLPTLSAVAHTELEFSDPAQGAQLTAPPVTVTLVFGGVISAESAEATITVGDRAAQQLVVTVVDDTLTAPVPIDPGPGALSWQVGYNVLSADGHPVSGVVDFTVTVAEPAASSPPPAPTSAAASPSASTGPTGSTPASPSATASVPAEPSGTTVSSDASLAADAVPEDSSTTTLLLWLGAAAVVAGGTAVGVVLTRRRRTH